MLAMPLFFALMSLVIDGGNILVHKRNVQVAADAAALAIAQDVGLASSTCSAACSDQGRIYAKKNGVNVDSSWHECDAAHTTNCWTYPYNGHNDEVEVRLKAHVTTFIAGVIGLYGADVSARAVAGTGPIYGATTTPGTTIQGTTTVSTIHGGTHTTTDPDQLSGGSGIAFTMSRVCSAIVYAGAGAKNGDPVLGAFATNGGFDFQGAKPKKVTYLAFNQSACPNNPSSPPSGTSACTAQAWGDPPPESNNLCAKTLANLHGPINWPIAPPTAPTPKTGPQAGTWDPPNDYPSKCISLGNAGTITFSTAGHPPGIYCVTGATTTLTIPGLNLAGGDGYTFFALGGAKIGVSGNSATLKFYWPSACGARPTTRGSFTCFGPVSGYDPQTLLYATNQTSDMTTCPNNAICLNGQGNQLTGDIFAPKPDVFPPLPGPLQTGGTVAIEGGALTAGSGFIESWNLSLKGNTGSYQGTGASLVIPGQTHTTTDPDTTTTVVIPGTTIAGTVQVTTIGTAENLNE
jgi:Flp pilus assembly protein TadG